MNNTFKIAKEIYNYFSYKGLPFLGAWFPFPKGAQPENGTFEHTGEPYQLNTHTDKGANLRKKDAAGRYYFMPVIFEHNGKEYEVPNAIIGYRGKKNIIETPLVGRRGTVKELINIGDYEISIAGAAVSSDFPESEINELNELFEINEAIELKCALTDLIMKAGDKVVIKDIDFGEMTGAETYQLVKISAVTDRAFDLIID